jgi:hypothetical protein
MKITFAKALAGFRLELRFEDATTSTVDLSDLAGRGVFCAWQQAGVFEQVKINDEGSLEWPGEIDLCADALYLRMTGKKPDELFPSLQNRLTHA